MALLEPEFLQRLARQGCSRHTGAERPAHALDGEMQTVPGKSYEMGVNLVYTPNRKGSCLWETGRGPSAAVLQDCQVPKQTAASAVLTNRKINL